jgi:Lar family restriction alleviation protein
MKIEPCPFCGEGEETYVNATPTEQRYVVCDNCGAEGPYGDTEIDAIKAWSDTKHSRTSQRQSMAWELLKSAELWRFDKSKTAVKRAFQLVDDFLAFGEQPCVECGGERFVSVGNGRIRGCQACAKETTE